MTSIRRALLVRLLLGLVAVTALATIATYVETRREIGELFDLQLKQLAYSTRIDDLLRGRAMGPVQPEGRRVAGVSEILTQIWDRDGVLVYWSQPGAGLPVAVTEGYSDVRQDGRNWRVYTHVSGDHAVQVAHAIDERRELAAQAALRTLLPMALLIPVFGLLIWYAVGHGLRPLETMSNAVATRRPDAMSPLSERGVPRELRPLAESLNALLARLDQAIGAQRRFTSEAAHELRTPLAALALQVGEVERAPDSGARDAAIADLKLGLARTSRLVEQLLTMARLEPEGLTRNFSRIDLVAITNEAIVARAPVAEARAIDLGCTETANVSVQGDAANIATLLANLLDNALRYTPSGGRIDVAITEDAGAALLTVADTGPGIPAAARERVFERFHREPNPDDATLGFGSGLGLSIVRRIAEAHGASVTLDSGADGKGLVARVRFPKAGLV